MVDKFYVMRNKKTGEIRENTTPYGVGGIRLDKNNSLFDFLKFKKRELFYAIETSLRFYRSFKNAENVFQERSWVDEIVNPKTWEVVEYELREIGHKPLEDFEKEAGIELGESA
jgi:hypothetical protein